MNWLSEMWRRLQFLITRRQAEDDLAEEMRLHLQLRAEDTARHGADPVEADAQARRSFGNVTQLRENGREAWGWRWLESIVQDIRYGIRQLAAGPGFTATAVVSLALGIGANTAIFTIVNAVMLRSLPVEDPRELVQLQIGDNSVFTNPIWEQVRDHQNAFSGMLAYSRNRFDLANGGERQFVDGLWVSGDFFRVLGVTALRGRMFDIADDQHHGGKFGPVAVISHRFWQSRLGGADVIGQTVRLNRHAFQIVGVAPPWFTGLDVDHGFDVAIPIGCQPLLDADENALVHRSYWWLNVLGRIPKGSTAQQAEARINSISAEVRRATMPEKWEPGDQKNYLREAFRVRPAATGFSETGSRYRTALLTLMAVVALVLLIACANIANLLLARATARQRELSIRLAIGAGRGRIVRQLLTESLLLSIAGAALGLLFARWGSGLLMRFLSTSTRSLELDLAPDSTVLLFTTAAGILTGILFGVAPALRATGTGPTGVLKENIRGSITGFTRFRLGKALVAGQVALSLVLLVGAGLFAGTMRNLVTTQTGFEKRNLVIASVDLSTNTPKAKRVALYQSILEKLQAVSGVSSVSSSLITPISNQIWDENVEPEGFHAKSRQDRLIYFNRVSPNYFRTMQTAILAGRDFTAADSAQSQKVMILNQTAATRFFGGGSTVGKTVATDVPDKPGAKQIYQIIGVVQDAKYSDLKEAPVGSGYLAMAQDPDPWPTMNFELRSSLTLAALAPSLRAELASVDSGISVEFRTLETQVNDSLVQQRMLALLSTFFGGLALVLAVVGLYGVTAYTVMRRQSEIGIRMALGARRGSVILLVLRDVTAMLIAGTIVGLAASLAAGRLVNSLLYGVKPADPPTLLAAALVLICATAIAGFIPALRASRLDPMAALRDE